MGTLGPEKQTFEERTLDMSATIAALRLRIQVLHANSKLGQERILDFYYL
jgi:hypothetical protein